MNRVERGLLPKLGDLHFAFTLARICGAEVDGRTAILRIFTDAERAWLPTVLAKLKWRTEQWQRRYDRWRAAGDMIAGVE